MSAIPEPASRCPGCGAPLEDGVCTPCVLRAALRPSPRPAAVAMLPADGFETGIPARFGDYELLNQLGEGGMGIVFRAWKLSLRKQVAIKFIKSGREASARQRALFLREAEVAAQLDHPHIINVSEVGEHDGLPYLVMRLVNGWSLDEYLARPEAPRTVEQRLALMATVCRAVHHAHQRGIIHRDLKPGNIIVDQQGQPNVGDFGLARWSQRMSTVTYGDGAAIGTPAFLSPEQVEGRPSDLTTATDVWSLGVILYAVINGSLPFNAPTLPGLLQRIVRDEPPPPQLRLLEEPGIDPAVGFPPGLAGRPVAPGRVRDLQSVCLRCLEKNPARRYPTAADLAADLERWLARLPVRARPVGPVERAVRWTRRHPAGSLALVLLVTAMAAVGTTLWQMQLRSRTEEMRRLFNQVADMSLATRALEEGNAVVFHRAMDAYRPLPGQPDPRGIEWDLLKTLADTRFARPWMTLTEPVLAVSVVADRPSVVFAASTRVVRVNERGETQATWIFAEPFKRASLALFPDGQRAVVGTEHGAALLGPAESDRRRLSSQSIEAVRVSDDGGTVALLTAPGEHGRQILLIDAATGETLGSTATDGMALGFSGGGRLRVVQPSGGVREWEARSDAWSDLPSPRHHCPVALLSPGGRYLLRTTMNGIAHVVDLKAPASRVVRTLEGVPASASAAAFSADERWGAVVGVDGQVLVFGLGDDAEGTALRRCSPGHASAITGLAFADQGRVLFTSSIDGSLRRLPLDLAPVPTFARVEHELEMPAGLPPTFSPDGRWAALVARRDYFEPTNHHSVLLDLERLKVVGRIPGEVVSWGPADRVLAWERTGRLSAWEMRDPANPVALGSFGVRTQPSRDLDIKLADHGRWLVSVDDAGVAEALDVTRLERRRLDPALLARGADLHPGRVEYLAVSPVAPLVAVGVDRRGVVLWGLAEGSVRWLQNEVPGDLRFSPDGRWLALTSYDGHALRLVDVGHPGKVESLAGQLAPVTALAFSQDGRRLLTGGEDLSLVVWDLATRREVFRSNLGMPINWISVADNGRWLVTGHLTLAVDLGQGSQGPGHYRLWRLGDDGRPEVQTIATRDAVWGRLNALIAQWGSSPQPGAGPGP